MVAAYNTENKVWLYNSILNRTMRQSREQYQNIEGSLNIISQLRCKQHE